jgi:DNA processing protein
VPGPVGTPGVEGCHGLINQGARLLDSARRICWSQGRCRSFWMKPPGQALTEQLPPEARKVFELIGVEPVHVDVLVRESGLAAQAVSAIIDKFGTVRPDQRPGR